MCQNPKIAYQRPFYPIDGQKTLTEKEMHQMNKLSFTYHEGWTQVELPCGQCDECRLQKANEWATRICCEAETWNGKGIFVTLTYNNPHLPIKNGHMTLKKRDMQLFKKRLRKYISKNNEALKYWKNPKSGKWEKPVRTFECGEYGPTKGRPHYHQIIFNWIPKDLKFKKKSKDGYPLYTSKTLQNIWGNGFVLIGMISYESASYVARYTMKKNGLAKQEREYYRTFEFNEETGELNEVTKYKLKQGLIEPEFITMSTAPGIGYNYFNDNIKTIKENNGIIINIGGIAKLKNIPRYFRKLWEKKDWEQYEKWKFHFRKTIEKLIQKHIDEFALPETMKTWEKENYVKIKTEERKKHKFKLLRRNNISNNIDN